MGKERKLVLDTETTGLSIENDKIIEIGIVELKENVLTQNYFHQYINPKKNISLSAQKIHGITNDFLINKPIFSEIAQKFLDFVKDDEIIIHNAEFDINFINKELHDCGFKDISNSIIDTVKIAKKEFPRQTVNLDSLCRKLNIINTRQNYHGALLDATLLSKVYLKLTTGKQEDLNLMNMKSVNLNKDNVSAEYKDMFKLPRYKLMNLSDEEKKMHKIFLADMKDKMWDKI